MLRILFGAAFALALSFSAHAQSIGQLGAGQVWGNPGAAQGPAIPANMSAMFDRAYGSTRGSVLERGASGWVAINPSATVGQPLVSGGTGADPSYGSIAASALPTVPLTVGGTNADNSAATTNDVLAYNGTSFIHTAILTVLNAVCTASPGTCATFFGYYNIAWYGAVSGADTSSRNSNALTNAMAACSSAGGGRVFIPVGNFQFATAQQQTNSNCDVTGINSNSSVVTYTGTGTAWTLGSSGSTLQNVHYSNFQIACSAACGNGLLIENVSENIVFSGMVFNGGASGAHAVQITSVTSSTGGSYDVHFNNGTVIQNCTSYCLYIDPLGVSYAQALYFDNVFFNGYATQAVYATSGSGMFFNHIHLERHPGYSNTANAMHFDTTNKVVLRDFYNEDEANAYQIELGASVNGFVVDGWYSSINVLGGTATPSGGFLTQTGGAPAPSNVTISNVYISAGGTVSNVINLGNVTKAWLNNITMSIGTSSGYGINSTATTTNVHIGGLVTSGTFTSGTAANALPVSCAAGISATNGTTDGYGAITHC